VPEETVTPPTPASVPKRRALRRTLAAVALVVLGFAGWHHWVELPAERRAAAAQQQANARTIPDLKLDLVWIPPGEFLMGSSNKHVMATWLYEARQKLDAYAGKPRAWGWPEYMLSANQRPVTRVTLSQPFWLGRTEVTQAQWAAVMGVKPPPTGSGWQLVEALTSGSGASHFKGGNLPVENKTWNDAMVFCQRLTEREREAGRLPAGYEFSLPTEAQWEYACRAGTTGDRPGDLNAMAWFNGNSGATTHPVGMKQPNAWGLFDMLGNVREYCRDRDGGAYPGGSVTNPTGPTSTSSPFPSRIVRGGCWDSNPLVVSSVYRLGTIEDSASILGEEGFRVALVRKTSSTIKLDPPNLTAP
jgi:formylglycine-generating enzyme required for sulfatase activity